MHHYGTKDRLFAAMHDLYMERRLAEAHQLLEKFDDPAERLAGLLFSFLLYQVVDRDSTVAFQREAATLATHDALIRGRQLRAAYLELVRGVLSDGIERGVFRPLDVQVQSLLIFGSSQWAWTWFHPDGDLTALDVGSSFVQLSSAACCRTAPPSTCSPIPAVRSPPPLSPSCTRPANPSTTESAARDRRREPVAAVTTSAEHTRPHRTPFSKLTLD